MRQGIESEREYELPKSTITVMFHGSLVVLGGFISLRARGSAGPTLPANLAVISHTVSDASSQVRLLPLSHQTPSPDRTRRRPLSHAQKSSAEGPMARSAMAVLMAGLNTRSVQAADNPITTLIKQRSCVAIY